MKTGLEQWRRVRTPWPKRTSGIFRWKSSAPVLVTTEACCGLEHQICGGQPRHLALPQGTNRKSHRIRATTRVRLMRHADVSRRPSATWNQGKKLTPPCRGAIDGASANKPNCILVNNCALDSMSAGASTH